MKQRSGFAVMGQLIGLVRPLAGYMVLAVSMGLAGHLCAAFLTVFGVYALCGMLGLPAPLGLAGLFGGIAVMAVLRAALRYGEQACNHFIAFKLLALLRDKVFRALRALAPARLEVRDRGDLISLITSDIELLEVFYAHTISPVLIAVLFSGILCAFIGSYHPLLGLLALGAYLCVGAVVPLLVSRASGAHGLRFRSASGELSSFVLDSLRGLPETLQYAQGAKRCRELDERTRALTREESRLKWTSGWGMALTNALILLFDLAMLLTAALLFGQGQVGFDGVVVPTVAIMSSFGPVVALAGLGGTLQQTFAAGNRVLDILQDTPVVQDVTGRPATEFAGASADRVSFSYEDQPILRDLSVQVPQNQILGIVGRSGSGKSTLLKLFMRFWETDSGEIRLSGKPVGQINTADLRNMESYVTQQTHLFHNTIRNNLRIARLDATDAEIEEACRKASVHDFILSLPRGYDTQVGELGDTLSGGERQRLGLARAFLHDAPFMLLDEPTSNLDSLNEAVILQSLRRERKGRTVVLVSHRQSTMRVADRVLHVDAGRCS